MSELERTPPGPALPSHVAVRLIVARLALIWERVWSAAWPATGVVGVFIFLTLVEAWHFLPVWLHATVLILLVAAAVVGLYRGFQGFAWPTRGEAVRRLERSSRLSHRPISALEDRLSAAPAERRADPATTALWARYQSSLRKQIRFIRSGRPRSQLPRRDPFALRFVIGLLLVVAVVRAGPDWPQKFHLAVNPGLPVLGGPPVTLDAWVNPPPYTGVAPIFLTRAEFLDQEVVKTSFEVPEGSELYVRVQGVSEAPGLRIAALDGGTVAGLTASDTPQFEQVAENVFEYADKLGASLKVAIDNGGRELGSWSFEVKLDQPPAIAFTEPPSETNQKTLKIPFTVLDDYGAVAARAVIRRKPDGGGDATADLDPTAEGDGLATTVEPPADLDLAAEQTPRVPLPDAKGAIVLNLPLPSMRSQRAAETAFENLTAHPWAGLEVTLQLFADDEAEQTGESEIVEMVLPEREFRDPLARGVIEQRKWLVLYPEDILRAARFIDAFTAAPEGYFDDFSVYLGLRSAYWRLTHAEKSSDLAGIYELLWDIAVRIEDGDLTEMAEALRELQRQLVDALNEGRDQDEIDRIMEALRQAMGEYLAELMRQGMDNMGDMGPMDPGQQSMSGQDLEELLEAIEDMLRAGDLETARQLLSQLMDMLESITSFSMMPGQGQGNSPLSEELGELGDMIGRQRGLLDETFRESQPQPGEPGDGQPGEEGEEPGEGNTGRSGRSSDELAGDQEALRRELEDILQGLRDQGVEVPNELDRAGRAMGESRDELEDGDPGSAVEPQKEAIDQLRQGAQSLAQSVLDEMARRQGRNEGPGDNRDYDPLGRPSASAGPEYGDSVKVPTERDRQRARDILEELRRRAGELSRPPLELDYLERLLKRF